MDSKSKIAIFVSFSGLGGVERMVLNLAQGLLDAGYQVDLVLVKAESEHAKAIPGGVRLINLNARHTLTSLPKLARYLKRERPVVLLAAKDRAIKTAVLARRLAGIKIRLIGRLGTTVSAALEGSTWFKKVFWYRSMRFFYHGVDRIVAVSKGVADDVIKITALPAERVSVVANPVWTSELMNLAQAPAPHPWLEQSEVPVILGSGRLTRQKDFATLIRAFARVRAGRVCRLIILGEGRLRKPLTSLATELGVIDDLLLPGFVTNPYAYITRANLFVLSSAWEGSPNVLTEALALGIPTVSTDCPSGPREILDGGRYGRLVAIGDAPGLADAMSATLDRPPERAFLQEAARPYTVDASTHGYLRAFGLEFTAK